MDKLKGFTFEDGIYTKKLKETTIIVKPNEVLFTIKEDFDVPTMLAESKYFLSIEDELWKVARQLGS